MNYPLVDYKGFQIDRFNTIFKNGKQVFDYQYSTEDAKSTIDNSLAAKLKAMRDKQAELNRLMSSEEDYREQDAEDFTDWMNDEAENQLNEDI